MAATDCGIRLYLLCISQSQENIIINMFQKKNWKKHSLVRVPETHLDAAIDLFERISGSGTSRKFPSEDHGSSAQPGSNETQCHKQLVVNDIVFQQVGLFDEVAKLAEGSSQSVGKQHNNNRTSAKSGQSQSTKRNSSGSSRIRTQSLETSDQNVTPFGGHEEAVTEMESVSVTAETDRQEMTNDGRTLRKRSCLALETKMVKHKDTELDSDISIDTSGDTTEDDESSSFPSAGEFATSKDTLNDDVRENDLDNIKTSNVGKTGLNQTKISSKYFKEAKQHANGKPRERPERKNMKKLKCVKERRERFQCGECGKGMASEMFFRRHMTMCHSAEAVERRAALKKRQKEAKLMQSCHMCGKQFVDKYGLQKHVEKIHSEDQMRYQCDLCGAVLKFKGSLVQHMKSVHTDKRPHTCNICNKRFKVPHQLKNHQRRHDPDFIETCTICGKTIKKSRFLSHMKRHSNIRPHKCTQCDKSFYEKQDLERHLMIHSGERPYKCPHCSYASSMRGNLTKHLKHVKHKPEALSVALHKLDTEPSRHADEQAAKSLYLYPGMPKSAERQDKCGAPVYLVRNQQHQPYSPGNQLAIPDKHGEKIKHIDIESIAEVEISSSNELGSRIHVNDDEMYHSQMQHTKVILSDNMHIHVPASHVEITKVPSSVDAVAGSLGATGYSDEAATLYMLKPAAGQLGYPGDEPRSYGAGQEEPREGLTQFRENYMQYMMPHVPDARYTNQY